MNVSQQRERKSTTLCRLFGGGKVSVACMIYCQIFLLKHSRTIVSDECIVIFVLLQAVPSFKLGDLANITERLLGITFINQHKEYGSIIKKVRSIEIHIDM